MSQKTSIKVRMIKHMKSLRPWKGNQRFHIHKPWPPKTIETTKLLKIIRVAKKAVPKGLWLWLKKLKSSPTVLIFWFNFLTSNSFTTCTQETTMTHHISSTTINTHVWLEHSKSKPLRTPIFTRILWSYCFIFNFS